MTKKRVLGGVVMAIVAITLVSSTVGREIYAGRSPGLLSFGIVHFAGYLFFLLMPVEALVPLYQAEGHEAMTLILIAVSTALAAQAIDYGIGRALSDHVTEELIGEERSARFKALIDKWGGWAILFFNLMPLSSPNMLLVAGITQYGARRAFLLSTLGLAGKYLAIVYLFGAVSGTS